MGRDILLHCHPLSMASSGHSLFEDIDKMSAEWNELQYGLIFVSDHFCISQTVTVIFDTCYQFIFDCLIINSCFIACYAIIEGTKKQIERHSYSFHIDDTFYWLLPPPSTSSLSDSHICNFIRSNPCQCNEFKSYSQTDHVLLILSWFSFSSATIVYGRQ